MRTFWFLLAIVSPFLSLLSRADTEITFKDHGKIIKKVTLKDIEKAIAVEELTVNEKHEGKQVTFRGFSTNRVFDHIYGKQWKKAEEVLFTCTDGYQPSIPVTRFEKFTSVLALQRKDRPEFTVANALPNGSSVDVGPFYLVWDNIQTSLKTEGMEDWPYKLVAVDIIQFSDRFTRLAPPEKSSQKVKQGFLGFRKRCVTCHTINGEGGQKAVELNYPVNVTEYFKEAYLKKWIADPASIRLNSNMPSYNRDSPTWSEEIDQIVAYLKAMVGQKKKPQ